MIYVHYAPPSIYGRKVLAALDEKGLDYEIKKMSFTTKDHLSEEYAKINPNCEIPTLQDEDFTVYESTAILEYLNDEYPEPPLLPQDSEGRARVRMIEDFCDLHLFRTIVKILIKKVFEKTEVPAEDVQRLEKEVKRIETYLGDKQFVAGDFSYADCAVMSAVASIEALDYGDSLKAPKLSAYISRLKKRAGWKGASLLSFKEEAVAK